MNTCDVDQIGGLPGIGGVGTTGINDTYLLYNLVDII